jgi:hypothetical protein
MLDAGFLHAEDSDRHVSLAIGAISVLAGPMPDFNSLAAGLVERILSVPRFRQVLRTQPLDLGAPQWVDDPNVDISHHVRRLRCPVPATMRLCSGGSPRSWSAASIETVRNGKAGSSTLGGTTGGRS